MTANEFIKNNADILTGVVKETDIDSITDGNVLFVVITAPGMKDIKERAVRTAGYYLVVSRNRNHLGRTTELVLVGLTAGGYAKVETVNLGDLDCRNNKMVFHCKPLPQNDIRRNYHFLG